MYGEVLNDFKIWDWFVHNFVVLISLLEPYNYMPSVLLMISSYFLHLAWAPLSFLLLSSVFLSFFSAIDMYSMPNIDITNDPHFFDNFDMKSVKLEQYVHTAQVDHTKQVYKISVEFFFSAFYVLWCIFVR